MQPGWEREYMYTYLGKRPLGRPRRTWEEENMKMYLRKIGCQDRIWMELALDCVQ
jgi:hypothetical protein